MCNYDFEILHYNEFENLTRDLLQVKFGIYIESFKDGKDGGIDLRFGIAKQQKCIVQVKKYKTYTSLKSQLSKESVKVKKLNPARYILSTSAPLSPANKEEIKNTFAPYIKDTEDIFGRDDINNLLGEFPAIEKRYYKLWLASTEILEELVHKEVKNWSRFELDTIKEEIKKYVINDSYQKALDILNKYGYVIISGIPGIGKSTLAHMLIYNLLASGYEEFVCIENDLREGVSLFQQGKTQVFFFDDFLGSNAYVPSEKDFENKLVSFIRAIGRENKNKLFIMTTREYILTQAKEQFEKFNLYNIDIAKCTLDMGTYSKYIKANILYNHIAEAHLPEEYIEQLLQDENYKQLIEHQYFNPRVIEIYIDRGEWQHYTAETFVPSFIELFNHPLRVWDRAFKNLPNHAKYALLVLGSMGREVFEKDWRTAYIFFCDQNASIEDARCSEAEWRESIRILEDCFIRTNKELGDLRVTLFNPSVLGFLVEYIRDYSDVQKQLVQGAYFIEQLYKVFTSNPSLTEHGDAYVLVSDEIANISKERLLDITRRTNGISCTISQNEHGVFFPIDRLHLLYQYASSYGWDGDLMKALVSIDELKDEDIIMKERLYFWSRLENVISETDYRAVFQSMINEDEKRPEDYLALLETLHSKNMKEAIDDVFVDKLKYNLDEEIEDNLGTVEETQALLEIVQKMAELLPVDKFPLDDYVESINYAEESIIENGFDYDMYMEGYYDRVNDDSRLTEMMTSLRITEE